LNSGEERVSTQIPSKFMKIIWVTKLSKRYNFKTSRIELTNALKKRGHNINLIMEKKIGEKSPRNKNVIYFPSESKPVFSSLVFGLLLIFYLPFIILRQKPDILLIDETTVWLPYVLGLKIFGIPLVLDVRTLPVENRRPLQFKTSLKLSKYLMNGYTMITPELSEMLKEKFNLGNKKIGIWSSGVSINNFSNLNVKNVIMENYRKSKNFILLYHGSYSPTRGVENLVKSIANLHPDIKKNILLLFVGIKQEKVKYLINLCRAKKVENNIDFISKVEYEKIPEFIYYSDVGIIPLPTDNVWWKSSSPLKTLEYLAMGKPIIATNIPFHKRIFEKGECGILLSDNEPKTLSDAITKLYQNRTMINKMGNKGREIVEKFYSWDCIALEVEKFLEKIIKNPI